VEEGAGEESRSHDGRIFIHASLKPSMGQMDRRDATAQNQKEVFNYYY
jgi:hypothetical protein